MPDIQLPQSRAGGQEQCWRGSPEHFAGALGSKSTNAKKVKVAKALDGQWYPCPA